MTEDVIVIDDCMYCNHSTTCETGPICELTNENLRDRDWKACEKWEKPEVMN